MWYTMYTLYITGQCYRLERPKQIQIHVSVWYKIKVASGKVIDDQ